MDSSDSEAHDIDIDNMLDEGLPDDLRERKKMHQYEEKSKLVLEGLFKHFGECALSLLMQFSFE